LFKKIKKWFMSFRASHIEVKGDPKNEISTSLPDITSIELSEKEIEFLLVTIKNGLFKGEYVETLYNLTLKLQKHFLHLKSKNIEI